VPQQPPQQLGLGPTDGVYRPHPSQLAAPSFAAHAETPSQPRQQLRVGSPGGFSRGGDGWGRVRATVASPSRGRGSVSFNPLDAATSPGGGEGGEEAGGRLRRPSRASISLKSRSSRDILAANQAAAAASASSPGGGSGLQVGIALTKSSLRAASARQRKEEGGMPPVPAMAAAIDARAASPRSARV